MGYNVKLDLQDEDFDLCCLAGFEVSVKESADIETVLSLKQALESGTGYSVKDVKVNTSDEIIIKCSMVDMPTTETLNQLMHWTTYLNRTVSTILINRAKVFNFDVTCIVQGLYKIW